MEEVSFKFKVGDIITFNENIISREYGFRILIPKGFPVKLVKITKNHILVSYNGKECWLRHIPDRMELASDIAIALYYNEDHT